MKSFIVTCPKCKGEKRDPRVTIGFAPPCPRCRGTGTIRKG
jgi:DnaJ-class molecular chaperone